MALAAMTIISCKKTENATAETTTETSAEAPATQGQEAVSDKDSAPDIVKLASGNKDLTTLVKAVQAAGLTTSLSNAGPSRFLLR